MDMTSSHDLDTVTPLSCSQLSTATLELRREAAIHRRDNSEPGTKSHDDAIRDLGRIEYELTYRKDHPEDWATQQEAALRV